jgi:hypothetical protein
MIKIERFFKKEEEEPEELNQDICIVWVEYISGVEKYKNYYSLMPAKSLFNKEIREMAIDELSKRIKNNIDRNKK